MKKFIFLLLITTTITSHSLSLTQLKKLKKKLENNPILKNHQNHNKIPRKLFTENEFQTGSAYVQQLQDTNSNLNEMMGHSKRQQEMKQVGQWFADVEEKLDDFRDGVARKLNELHMSLQRPKVPMIGPAPGVVMHPYGNNQYDNHRRSGLKDNFESPEHTHEESIKKSDNFDASEKSKKKESDKDMGDMMDEERRVRQVPYSMGRI